MRRLGGGLGAALLLWTAAPLGARPQDEAKDTQAFSIPQRTEALRKAREAQEHMDARRWSLAVQILQQMLEQEADAVLPSSYRWNADRPSVHEVHPGAAEWARRHLLGLPAEARAVYRSRYGPTAREALERGLDQPTRKGLVAISWRWPLCDAAVRAWWVLGDLELEAGHPSEALVAWERAERVRALLGQPQPAGLAARRQRAQELLGAARGDEPGPAGEPALPVGLPSRDARGWVRELDLEPFDDRNANYALVPVKADGRVLVSSGLRLFCVDAFTGELLWETERPEGWELLNASATKELFDGIHYAKVLVAPAARGRVAVAALQMPFSQLQSQLYRGIEVMRSIPQRRLFAFDLETGAPLWNHAPQLSYAPALRGLAPTGDLTFAQQMLVAGPPVITGSRVLVPCYALEGRIDYQVACYELETGALLWNTGVISGQRSRNMFGRALREFCASPLVVADDRVIAQSELGTVAALDLLTGGILWESQYRQVPLLPVSSYRPTPRPTTWITSPPVVTGDVVLTTPSDSDELYALDLTDGRVLWSYDEAYLRRLSGLSSGRRFRILIGAEQDTVYLGGRQVAALRKGGGLESPQPFQAAWAVTVDVSEDPLARPILCGDELVVPTSRERLVLDVRTGTEKRPLSGPWDRAGNPAFGSGILVNLAPDGLRGFFDWDALLERQRRQLAAHPDDPEVALTAAELFARRADVALEEGELFAALGFLGRARRVLEEVAAGAGGARGRELLHRVLRGEALALERQGDRNRSLTTLTLARELAPSRVALRDTLLQEERLLRQGHQRAAHLEVLATLEEQCGDLPMPRARLEQARNLLGLQGALEGPGVPSVPVGLWVLFSRASDQRQAGDLSASFADWLGVLERYEDVPLGDEDAGALARRRMAHELSLPRGREAYRPFEERAAELLDVALEARDLAELERISHLFPHSRAARDADRARLEWAFQQGDVERVAGLVYGSSAHTSADDSRRGLLQLAFLLGRAGNAAFERGVVAHLAREAPDAPWDLDPSATRPLQEVLEDLSAQVPARESFPPHFSAQPRVGEDEIQLGPHAYVGTLTAAAEAESAPRQLLLYVRMLPVDRSQPQLEPSRPVSRPILLLAYASDAPGEALWWTTVEDEFTHPTRPAQACALAEDRILLGGERRLHAFDPAGSAVWSRELDGSRVAALRAEDGVVVALTYSPGSASPDQASAFDVTTGVPLWSLDLAGSPNAHWRQPLTGEGRVVFFSKVYDAPTEALVVDLFRGLPRARFDVGTGTGEVEHAAWLDRGRLLVPHFKGARSEQERLVAHQLDTGRELWSQPLPEDEEFAYLARHEDAVYVITVSNQPGRSGGVYALDVDTRKLRQILPLRNGEFPIGLEQDQLTDLETPDLFIQSSGPDQGYRLRRLRLPTRVVWTAPLPFTEDVDRVQFFRPVMSRDVVAVTLLNRRDRQYEARLFFLDQRTGRVLHQKDLDRDLARSSQRLEVQGLGDTLFVAGLSTQERGNRLQIIQTEEENQR